MKRLRVKFWVPEDYKKSTGTAAEYSLAHELGGERPDKTTTAYDTDQDVVVRRGDVKHNYQVFSSSVIRNPEYAQGKRLSTLIDITGKELNEYENGGLSKSDKKQLYDDLYGFLGEMGVGELKEVLGSENRFSGHEGLEIRMNQFAKTWWYDNYEENVPEDVEYVLMKQLVPENGPKTKTFNGKRQDIGDYDTAILSKDEFNDFARDNLYIKVSKANEGTLSLFVNNLQSQGVFASATSAQGNIFEKIGYKLRQAGRVIDKIFSELY